MGLSERGLVSPTVSLADLATGARARVTGHSELSLADYTEEIVRSGFPAIRGLNSRLRRQALDSYLDRILERDFLELGQRVRRPATLRAWLAAYAAATSTPTRFERIRDAATPGSADPPAQSTTAGYREVLTRLWLLDPVPGWLPTRNPFGRLRSAPKHHLADPALAACLLDADPGGLLSGSADRGEVPRDGTLLGALFESLVTLSVRVLAQAAEMGVYHLRTREGRHEVDLILRRRDGKILAFEVKLSPSVSDADVRHLVWLRNELGEDLLDAGVITTGSDAYRRRDGFAVIPASLLGP
jgi:hypothetical protein